MPVAGLLLAGVLVACLFCSVAVSAARQRQSDDSAPLGAHAAFLPLLFRNYPSLPPPWGVQLFPGQMSEAVVDRVSDLGARWIRVPFSWYWVEPINTTPANYVWPSGPAFSHYDEGIALFAAHDIRVILTFQGNPSWAATYQGGPIDKVDLGELVEFVDAAVRHYAAPPYNVKYWEFYNEPDNGSEAYASSGWGYFGYEPAAYAQLLAAVYPVIKAADPDIQVVLGGLAYDRFAEEDPDHALYPHRNPFVKAFLDGVLAQGGSAYFDVMNFHYYPPFHAKWDPYGPGIVGKATYLRDLLASHGVHKPVMCTETSMWSDDLHQPPGSDELQSRYVVQAYVRSQSAALQTTIWYTLLDRGEVGETKYGLLHADLSPKPSYRAYKTLTEQLAGARYVRALGADETGSPQVEAYEFSSAIVVAWSNDALNYGVVFQAGRVAVVDKYGGETVVYDDDHDGRVQVVIGPSPIYLHLHP